VTSSPKGKGIIPFVVEITLNESQQKPVKIEENQGKDGEFSVSFTPTIAGQPQISVSHKGKHFKGSPFRIDVVDRPKVVYRRDYNAVGTNPVLRFGSGGSGDGQFSNPYGVACNSRGDIIVVENGNNRVQVFDKAGKFLFNSGQMEKEMGSFPTLMVSLLTREITKLWLAIIPIIASKYLMRRVVLFVPLGHLEVATVN